MVSVREVCTALGAKGDVMVGELSTDQTRAKLDFERATTFSKGYFPPPDPGSFGEWQGFNTTIENLFIRADLEKGIRSKIESKEGGDSKYFVRDATNAGKATLPENQYANWAIMGLNYWRCAVRLLENGKDLSLKEEWITSVATAFLKKISSDNCKDPRSEYARFMHSVVIPFTKKNLGLSSNSKAKKLLSETKDFCNFEHDRMVLVTKLEVDDEKGQESSTYLQVDRPLVLPMEESSELRRIFGNNDGDHKTKRWYEVLDEHVKTLVDFYAKDIISGKIIPTQLRKFIPGLRNAYQSRLINFEKKQVLFDHELIKIRVNAQDREARKTMEEKICEATEASWIQTIGHILVIYKKKEAEEK